MYIYEYVWVCGCVGVYMYECVYICIYSVHTPKNVVRATKGEQAARGGGIYVCLCVCVYTHEYIYIIYICGERLSPVLSTGSACTRRRMLFAQQKRKAAQGGQG